MRASELGRHDHVNWGGRAYARRSLRLLVDLAWSFSSVSSWGYTGFYHQFLSNSTGGWGDSAFVSWPGLSGS